MPLLHQLNVADASCKPRFPPQIVINSLLPSAFFPPLPSPLLGRLVQTHTAYSNNAPFNRIFLLLIHARIHAPHQANISPSSRKQTQPPPRACGSTSKSASASFQPASPSSAPSSPAPSHLKSAPAFQKAEPVPIASRTSKPAAATKTLAPEARINAVAVKSTVLAMGM